MSNTSRKRAQIVNAAPIKPAAAYMSGDEYFSAGQLSARWGVHVTTVWKWSRTRRGFPQPVKLSESTTRWRRREVEAWETKYEAARAPEGG